MKSFFLPFFLLGLVTTAHAAVREATADETAWFAGQWATSPADVPGYETTGSAPDCSRAVTIRAIKDNVIVRETRLKDGSLHSAEFAVKQIGQNFPWWPTDGGSSSVAKRTGDDVFLLARTGEMGRADWNKALQHTRCKSIVNP